MLTNHETNVAQRIASVAETFESVAGGLRVEFSPALMRLFLLVAQNEGATQATLADLAGVKRPTLSIRLMNLGDLDRRIGAGLKLVEQRIAPDDRRAREVYLTDKGRELFKRLVAAYEGIECQSTPNTAAEERAGS